MALLEEAHVATVHGAAYGMSPYLRVSTATDDASLAEGCRRIAGVLRRAALSQRVDPRRVATADADGLHRPDRRLLGANIPASCSTWMARCRNCVRWPPTTPARAARCGRRKRTGSIVGMIGARAASDGAWEICPALHAAAASRGSGPGATTARRSPRRTPARPAPTRLVLWSDTRFDRAHRFYEKHSYVRHGPIRVLHDISNSLEFGYAKPVAGHRGAGRRRRRVGRTAAGGDPVRLRRCRRVGLLPAAARAGRRARLLEAHGGRRRGRHAHPARGLGRRRAGRHRDAGIRVLAEPAASRRGAEAAGASRGATPGLGARADGPRASRRRCAPAGRC